MLNNKQVFIFGFRVHAVVCLGRIGRIHGFVRVVHILLPEDLHHLIKYYIIELKTLNLKAYYSSNYHTLST